VAAGLRAASFEKTQVPRRNFGLCGKIELTDFYIFHNRKPIQMRAFVDRQEALDWAGAKESL
jgi:hypothetical protein